MEDDLRPEYDLSTLRIRKIGPDRRQLDIEQEIETMNQWEKLNVVERDAGKVSGAWLFRGTRVPVTALFENLRDGATINEFLAWFPGVERHQVEAVLEHELETLMAA